MNAREVSNITHPVGWKLLDANKIAVTIIDRNDYILSSNETAIQSFGKSAEQIEGCWLWDFYPKAIRYHHQIVLNEVKKTGCPITLRYKDQDLWKKLLIFPLLDNDNQVNLIALYVSDITAQVKTEERLRQILMELITAQEDERHRISQDLHDDVGQKLTVLILELRAIKEKIENENKVSLKEINNVIRNLEDIIKHVRQTFYQLHPPSLNRMALPKVLAAFCTMFEETNSVHVDFSCQEELPEFPDDYNNAIYRFIQEGLTNVAKHAKASSAWINLDYTDGDLNISVEDNGQGFELHRMTKGIGLHGIQDRFLLLGGAIDIESIPGKGTRLSGTIPYAKAGRA